MLRFGAILAYFFEIYTRRFRRKVVGFGVPFSLFFKGRNLTNCCQKVVRFGVPFSSFFRGRNLTNFRRKVVRFGGCFSSFLGVVIWPTFAEKWLDFKGGHFCCSWEVIVSLFLLERATAFGVLSFYTHFLKLFTCVAIVVTSIKKILVLFRIFVCTNGV